MATFPEFTNQGIPSEGNPSPFPSFGNVGAPYMATMSLPGLTVGFPIWLFLTSVALNVPTSIRLSPSPEQHHVDLKIDPSPSFPGESLDSINQVAKKKKKSKKKK